MTAVFIIVLLCLLVSFDRLSTNWWTSRGPLTSYSSDGRWYVVLRPRAEPCEALFDYFQTKDPRVPSVALRANNGAAPGRFGRGDRRVACGKAYYPEQLFCLNGGIGLVLFGSYPNTGYGLSVMLRYGRTWRTQSISLGDMFSEDEVQQFSRSVRSIYWNEGVWINERTREVVCLLNPSQSVPDPNRVVRVSVDTGVATHDNLDPLWDLIRTANVATSVDVLKWAQIRKRPGLVPVARDLFYNESTDAVLRVYLAATLCRIAAHQVATPAILSSAKDARAHLDELTGLDYEEESLGKRVAILHAIKVLASALGEDARQDLELCVEAGNTLKAELAAIGLKEIPERVIERHLEHAFDASRSVSERLEAVARIRALAIRTTVNQDAENALFQLRHAKNQDVIDAGHAAFAEVRGGGD